MSKLELLIIPKTKSREAFTRNDVSSFRQVQIPGDGLQREEVGGSYRAKLLKICATNGERVIRRHSRI
jgi:hypothetical protein